MRIELVLVFLFTIATAVAMLARRFKVPYTVALVVAGLALGTTDALAAPHLTKDLLYAVFLPGLLFEAAFHLDYEKFVENKLAVTAMAVPGVVLGIGLTALLLTPAAAGLHFVEDFTLRDGLVFGALLAATDPIAVVSLFKSLGAPKRLAVLVEGESLLNDGTAVVAFTIVLGLVAGGPVSGLQVVFDFVRVVGVGLFIGVVVGVAASKVVQTIDDPMIEITVTTVAAYGSFVAAESFHFSGVIATVAAGMLCGNYGARTGMSPSTRIAVESFWEYVAFALNSIVFLLIGLEVQLETLVQSAWPIVLAFLAVTGARALVVFAMTFLLKRTRERFPTSWAAVVTWGGLRGGLSMVLVLALPADFVHRDLLVTLTFGVVVLSILVQGLTMGPLLRFLKLVKEQTHRAEYDRHLAEVTAAQAALAAADRMASSRAAPTDVLEPVRQRYGERLAAAEEALRGVHLEQTAVREEQERAVMRQLLLVERDAVTARARSGALSEDAATEVLREIDARLVKLREH